jgi:hypothetical protein
VPAISLPLSDKRGDAAQASRPRVSPLSLFFVEHREPRCGNGDQTQHCNCAVLTGTEQADRSHAAFAAGRLHVNAIPCGQRRATTIGMIQMSEAITASQAEVMAQIRGRQRDAWRTGRTRRRPGEPFLAPSECVYEEDLQRIEKAVPAAY